MLKENSTMKNGMENLNSTLDAIANLRLVPPAIHDLESLDESDLESIVRIYTTTGKSYGSPKNLYWDKMSSSIWFNTTRDKYTVTVQLNAHTVSSIEFKGTVGPTKY